MIGDFDPSNWTNPTYPIPLDAYTIEGQNDWAFTLEQFAFGLANKSTTNSSEVFMSYANLTSEDYNEALVSLGHPGIGLPSPIFTPFVEILQNLTNNIWNCKESYGYFCYAPVKC